VAGLPTGPALLLTVTADLPLPIAPPGFLTALGFDFFFFPGFAKGIATFDFKSDRTELAAAEVGGLKSGTWVGGAWVAAAACVGAPYPPGIPVCGTLDGGEYAGPGGAASPAVSGGVLSPEPRVPVHSCVPALDGVQSVTGAADEAATVGGADAAGGAAEGGGGAERPAAEGGDVQLVLVTEAADDPRFCDDWLAADGVAGGGAWPLAEAGAPEPDVLAGGD